jgi:hypothetical protein
MMVDAEHDSLMSPVRAKPWSHARYLWNKLILLIKLTLSLEL